jgi:hypothetical protein
VVNPKAPLICCSAKLKFGRVISFPGRRKTRRCGVNSGILTLAKKKSLDLEVDEFPARYYSLLNLEFGRRHA